MFPILTARTWFPKEVDLTNILLTSRTIWPTEVTLLRSDCTLGCQNLEGENAHVPQPQAISKPSGQVSEVNKGGYSLPKVLGWESKQYKAIQDTIHAEAKSTLDIGKPYSKQKKEAISCVCQSIAQKYVFLQEKYEDDWVIKDFLKMYLKNSSRSARGGRVTSR